MNTTIGDSSHGDWKLFIMESLKAEANNLEMAKCFLQLAYFISKEDFTKTYLQLWHNTIWNSYAETLFLNPEEDHTHIPYLGYYDISNRVDPTDLFYPFYKHLRLGQIPLKNTHF